jgi:predicted TIM-barrel fold metal-dependent hydrolase
MDEQTTYVGGTAALKHRPSDDLTSGRFFCSIELHEGEDIFNIVSQFLGDNVLMYASDYLHPECRFPGSVDHALGWSSVVPETQKKLLWDNAVRFYKRA